MSYVIVPEGQAPPFETVDDKHHSAWVIITAAIELSVSLVCLLIRIYVRLFLSPPFGLSDSIVVLATVRIKKLYMISNIESSHKKLTIVYRNRTIHRHLCCSSQWLRNLGRPA